MRPGQDVGDLGHEVHAAEHDVFRLGLRSQPRQAERIAGEVGVLVDVGPLVVVAQDGRAGAQLGPGSDDPRLTGVVVQGLVVVE